MIKYLLILTCLSVQMNSCIAQKKPMQKCDVLLKPMQQDIKVFEKPNGKVLYSIINDTLNENYYNLLVSESKNGWFKIQPFSILDTNKTAGWIKVDYTGVYARNYSGFLKLFSNPNSESKVLAEIKEYFTDMLNVLDCKNGWLLVYIKLGDTQYKGWLRPEDQCANQYTTCN